MQAAKALIRFEVQDPPEDAEGIVADFKRRFHDTELFNDPFAGSKFAQYFFRAAEDPPANPDADRARRSVEEAQLFLEAAHSCHARLLARRSV